MTNLRCSVFYTDNIFSCVWTAYLLRDCLFFSVIAVYEPLENLAQLSQPTNDRWCCMGTMTLTGHPRSSGSWHVSGRMFSLRMMTHTFIAMSINIHWRWTTTQIITENNALCSVLLYLKWSNMKADKKNDVCILHFWYDSCGFLNQPSLTQSSQDTPNHSK